ncbi:MAG: tetratricopeptide repeat protein [Deltaproteobacteria bacterium]
MPCNFRLRQIGWIFFLFLVSSCSEKTSLQIFQPAEIDTSGIQRIAIGVFEIGVVQENIAVERAGDWTKKSAKLTDEERQILSRNIRTRITNQLTKVPFFEVLLTDEFSSLENDAALQQMIATQSYITRDVDAVLSGKIWLTSERLDGVDLQKISLKYFTPADSQQKIPAENLTIQQLVWWPYKQLSGSLIVELELVRLQPTEIVATDLVHRRFAQRVGGSPVGIVDQAKKDTSFLRDSLEGQNEDQPAASTTEGLPSLTAIVGEMVASVGADFVRRVSPIQSTVEYPVAEEGDEQARLLILGGAYESALQRLQGLTARDPNSEDLYNLGFCFEALGDYGLALLNYRAAHQMDGTNLVYAQGIGRIENLQRQFPKLRSQIQSRKL